MKVKIYIHSDGNIVEKFDVEVDSLKELQPIYDQAQKKYGSLKMFCFDVMIE